MTIRLGLIAASRIAESAVVEAAPHVDGVDAVAVAARELARAEDAARRWGIPRAFGSYEELIADDAVDAVYIGTPHTLHREWAIAAIAAGKHVLCEKPLAANAVDARSIAEAAAARPDVVVMEAFHWRYHPYAAAITSVIESGALGAVRRVEAAFDIPDGWIGRDDIRWNHALGGGATMDLGCYSIQWVRHAVGGDPSVLPEVVSAEAVCPLEEVDGWLRAELRWPSGVTGSVQSSMISPAADVQAWLKVIGDAGTLYATNPLAPQHGGAVMVVDAGGAVAVTTIDDSSTYVHQLAAFRDAITVGAPFPSTIADGVRNMEVIDACYRAAGMSPRPTHE